MAATIKILMLTDGDGAFDQAQRHRFGLTALVDTLRSDVGDGVKYLVTTAHRYPKPGQASPGFAQAASADLTQFRFDAAFTAAQFDEVWLVANASSAPAYGDPPGFQLADAELEVVQQFMEGGGGLFAVGDHDDLGRDLCGRIPRVRSMRRWEFDYAKAGADYAGYDEAGPDSPPAKGPHRHSTVVKAANGRYEFDNQSDDLPQTIRPVLTTTVGGTRWARVTTTFPHPLLCGRDGPIDVLPDHMHEGQCQVPDDLTRTYASGGAQRPEYPAFLGRPLPPQVVAWQDIVGRPADPAYLDPGKASGYDDNEALESDTCACIAAWDGHLAAAGRVVVDSTFHHFVDVNVLGVGVDATHDWAADEADKSSSFAATPRAAGQAAYRHIRQYWRNIARWLAPAARQSEFRLGWIRTAALDGRLRELTPVAHGLDGTLRFGAAMESILGVHLPPCARVEVSCEGVPDPLSLLLGHWYVLLTLPDPPAWVTGEEVAVDLGVASRLALGAAGVTAQRLLRAGQAVPDAELRHALRGPVAQALEALVRGQLEGLHTTARLGEALLRSMGQR